MNGLAEESDELSDLNLFRFPSKNPEINETFDMEEYELNPDSIMEVDSSAKDQNDLFLSKLYLQSDTNKQNRSNRRHLSNSSNVFNHELTSRTPTSPRSPNSFRSPGNPRNSVCSTMSSASSRFSAEVPSSRVKELDSAFQFETSYQFKGNRTSIQAPVSPFGTRYDFEKPNLFKKDISSSFLTSDRVSKPNSDLNSENTLDLYKTFQPATPTPRRVSMKSLNKYRHSRNLSISSSPISPQEHFDSAHTFMDDSRSRHSKDFSIDNDDSRRTVMNEYTYEDRLTPTCSNSDLKNLTNTHTDFGNNNTGRSISYEEFDDKNTGMVKSSSSSIYSLGEGEIITLKHKPSIVYITTDATTKSLDLGRIDQS